MTALPPPGSVVAGKYRIESLIGEGGMGAVFRAHHELMDKPVALKCLHPELSARADAKERFVREARAAARIRHPNVVEVLDVGDHDGALFMVMELLVGESFSELIREQRLPVRHALTILIDAMEGVAAAHARGIVHRDIKPENIFVVHGPLGGKSGVDPQDVVKILDFGVSKLTDSLGGSGSVTLSGQAVGTPEYMAPEQMLGEPDVDARADVYSFGVLLYRVLTGEAPFRGDNFAAIAVQVATQRPVSPREIRPEIPVALERIVMRAMAREREERYVSLRALIDVLRPIATGDTLSLLMPLATHVAARGSSIARNVVSGTGRRAMATVWIPLLLGLLLAMWARYSRTDARNDAADTRDIARPALPTADSYAPANLAAPADAPTQITPQPTVPGATGPQVTPEPEAVAPVLGAPVPGANDIPEPIAFFPDPEPEPPVRKPHAAADAAAGVGGDAKSLEGGASKRRTRTADGVPGAAANGTTGAPHDGTTGSTAAPGASAAPSHTATPSSAAAPADGTSSTAFGLRSGTLNRGDF